MVFWVGRKNPGFTFYNACDDIAERRSDDKEHQMGPIVGRLCVYALDIICGGGDKLGSQSGFI
jgi:hypothetical protein